MHNKQTRFMIMGIVHEITISIAHHWILKILGNESLKITIERIQIPSADKKKVH